MALTMTRTQTQTALTKLAERVANVHGELEFVEGQLANELGCRNGMRQHPEKLRRNCGKGWTSEGSKWSATAMRLTPLGGKIVKLRRIGLARWMGGASRD
ncbi:MAG: hypothetical protein KIT63_02635 [Rhodoferax sp.]|nr:hypothetical protein [Rhodoferax sp.]